MYSASPSTTDATLAPGPGRTRRDKKNTLHQILNYFGVNLMRHNSKGILLFVFKQQRFTA